ncbi:uncharacterized protein Triagg1_271 [Trichoderma aggressivum f. europaeum]|uniref:Uncharacterized protein n=1 Tax=Trichoderma aggressivum f. europaeum TaxID=173218 RepID=A0AAE1IK17_9HYPO|nr:hypothetical protein Triagg1_271 [Trichoderma aggressivum f. europaeum]
MEGITPVDGSPSCSHIESLPWLIRYNVMVRLDLPDLNALACASPILYRQVKQDRPRILYGGLKTMLGNTLLDAYAVYQTSSPPFTTGIRDIGVVQPFLESYAKRLRTEKAGPSLGDLSEEAIIAMWTFQTTIVAPLVEVFARWTLGNLSNLAHNPDYQRDRPPRDGPEASRLEVDLSVTERMRILRGMYRFQLYCHLFGAQCRGRPRFGHPYMSRDDVFGLVHDLFEPWEFEEFVCIQYYAWWTWWHTCQRFGDEIDETSPLFEEVTPPDPWGKRLTGSVEDHVINGTASRGLRPIREILFVAIDHAHRIRLMHELLAWPTEEYIDFTCSSPSWQWKHRRINRSERDWKEFRREPLPFNGEGESDQSNLRPPAAWVMLWEEKYSNIRTFEDDLLYWGYVMWDRDRIDSTGAEKIIFSQRLEFLPLGDLDYSSPEEEEESEYTNSSHSSDESEDDERASSEREG